MKNWLLNLSIALCIFTSACSFATAPTPGLGKMTASVHVSDVQDNSATLTISATDTFKPKGAISYTVTLNGKALAIPQTGALITVPLTDLTPKTTYSVEVTAKESGHMKHPSPIASTQFTTKSPSSSGKITVTLSYSDVTNTTATLNINASDTFTPTKGTVSYAVTINPGNIKKAASGLSVTIPLTGLSASTSYTATVSAKDSAHPDSPATATTRFNTAGHLTITGINYSGFGSTALIVVNRISTDEPTTYVATATPVAGGNPIRSASYSCGFNSCTVTVNNLRFDMAYDVVVTGTEHNGTQYVGTSQIPTTR